jgi:ABC-type transport system involved in cytochrome c biogenesis permease subunit
MAGGHSAFGTVRLVHKLAAFAASLRLTVALFALSIVLVLAGTLAQIDHDIWYVVQEYFRSWVAWIELKVFFPRDWGVGGVLPFPGGWTLGTLLAINLLAAHLVRFRIVAQGSQLALGGGLVAAGVLITYAVVQSGLGDTVKGQLSPEFSSGLWHFLRAAMGLGTLLWAYRLTTAYTKRQVMQANWLWWLGCVSCLLLGGLTVYLFTHPDVRLDPSGLRILWQLTKGGAAGLVLLAGCYLVFGRRAGIVLLHGGIALIMFSELHTGLTAQESRMQIAEGQTVNYAEDIRSTELALIDKSDTQTDKVTVVPASLLQEAATTGEAIEVPGLNLAVKVVKYFPNAVTRMAQPGETVTATEGWGALRIAEERPLNAGTDQGVDLPAAYVEVLSSKARRSLGTYLVWALPSSAALVDTMEVDGKPLEIEMRFKRIPKSYSVHLIDFRFDRYVGTQMAKNFSSEVRLTDPENNVDQERKIWMNNPLRYGGDTLYQADWDKETERGTVLQVVSNTGWMIPYVACMLVGTGMLFHFGLTLRRFAGRTTRSTDQAARVSLAGLLADWRNPNVWIPLLITLVFVGWVAGQARPPKSSPTEIQIHQFGRLPVAYEGRIQPIDTLARNVLTVFSDHDKAELVREPASSDVPAKTTQVPAIRWFLDYVTAAPAAEQYRVFRIENLEVLQTLDLQQRPGFRYSEAELAACRQETARQWQLASAVPEGRRTLMQKKFLELGNKIMLYSLIQNSFAFPAIRTDTKEHMQADFAQLSQEIERLEGTGPRAIPPMTPDQPWQVELAAERDLLIDTATKRPINEATPAFRKLLQAYRNGDLEQFNTALADYQDILTDRAAADAKFEAKQRASHLTGDSAVGQRKVAESLHMGRIAYEAWFNHFNPFVLAMALYLVSFVLIACSWLGWYTPLNRSANWLLWCTFLLHSFALISRIYISGRPPVTNLYSSAVFIGWGAVLFALIDEYVSRRSFGNLVAAVVGFPTLFVAYNLAGDGDTFKVLQAVLDTQFWLATHVVCITLGYSTTFLAGVMGSVYVLARWLERLDEDGAKQLVRMIYGTLCFATFFSFIGTVLGGLWADDSWGRFWGWDPKENGALIIVLWNALVLHARWGGMIAQRGLAVLAIFGNVVTAWSWFGVNLMNVGLHSYGFTEGRDKWLLLFVAGQLAVMLLGQRRFCHPVSSEESSQREKRSNWSW